MLFLNHRMIVKSRLLIGPLKLCFARFRLLPLLTLAVFNLLLGPRAQADDPLPVQTVFFIVMENYNWSAILGSANGPYINNTLLSMASYCQQYYNPPGLHPSEPNYLWLQ